MPELSFIALIIPSFIAGILIFLAPCTLPLAPAYLGFISGVSLEDLKDPAKASLARRKIFINGVFFVLGFTVIFVALGVLTGLLGLAFAPIRLWLIRIGGVFLILMGLFLMRVFKLPFLNQEKKLKLPAGLTLGKPHSSFILGNAFGIGWTPCSGPILVAISALAATTGTAVKGGVLLAIFSAGLAVPFLLMAIGIGSATKFVNKISKYLTVISFIGGIFLLLFGVLMLMNRTSLLLSWGFQLLDFLNYGAIVERL